MARMHAEMAKANATKAGGLPGQAPGVKKEEQKEGWGAPGGAAGPSQAAAGAVKKEEPDFQVWCCRSLAVQKQFDECSCVCVWGGGWVGW